MGRSREFVLRILSKESCGDSYFHGELRQGEIRKEVAFVFDMHVTREAIRQLVNSLVNEGLILKHLRSKVKPWTKGLANVKTYSIA